MKKNILIYDDDLEILFLCKTILQHHNYEVETLSKCEDVHKDIERVKPDLILMDLWIPVMGGEKAVALVKENKATEHIPVLLFSANADIRDISEKVNASGFIEKPFDVKSFVSIVQDNVG